MPEQWAPASLLYLSNLKSGGNYFLPPKSVSIEPIEASTEDAS